MLDRQKGFAHLLLVVILLSVAAVSLVAWRIYKVKSDQSSLGGAGSSGQEVSWYQDENGWAYKGTLPKCPSQVRLPIDIGRATSVLYPGQYRGGEYKPHGGFRFDNEKTNEVTITAPFDAELVRGAKYMAKGDIQYVFDFIAPCGYMYRLGHLLTLSPKLAEASSKLPLNGDGDSRDSDISPRVKFTAGEVIAVATGMSWGNGGGDVNVFVDWGVYDLKQKNEASKNKAWAAKHPYDTEQYALCWFDLLSPADEAKVRALPAADGTSGKASDYCL